MSQSDSQNAIEAALAHHRAGRVPQAEQLYSQVLAREPENINALRLLAILLHQTGRSAPAVEMFSRAAALASDQDALSKSQLLMDFAMVRHQLDEIDAANELCRRAIALDANNVDAHRMLAANVARLGDIKSATRHAAIALSLCKDQRLHSNRCLLSLNDPALDGEQILEIHRDWDRDYGTPALARLPKVPPHANDRRTDRQLRIGYVSPDFRQHAVRYFIHPILANHDRAKFHITGYSNAPKPDAVTRQFQSLADEWQEIGPMNLDQIEAQIRADKIDILIDLAGHTQNSPIAIFARRPAPVQVSMIGYPGTTGLSAIDYRITDVHCDPPGNEKFSSEKLVRLGETLWCFSPLDEDKAITDLPAKSNDYITVGSVNSCSKLTDEVLNAWARIIVAIPNSKLVMQHSAFSAAGARQRVLDALARHGVNVDVVRFSGFTSISRYIDLIRTFDIALDPFPYNGGTTTCHLLHNGVPIVALAGERHSARMGVSALHAVGLSELVAQSTDDYIAKTVALAGDLDRLGNIRAGLRDRMMNSALCDARGHTLKLEDAFRAMWKMWCEQPRP